MAINKKGVLFTMVTIIILSLFATSYMTYTLFKNRSPINDRITTLNNFVGETEQNLPRQIYISGYRAIFLMEKKTIDTGAFIPNTTSSLNELFFNGTLNGTHEGLMDDATFSSLQKFLSANAAQINANITLLNPSISITQTNPWSIKIMFNTTMIIKDKNNLAEWNRTLHIKVFIPIQNFNDPLYSINTAGKVLNKINKTPYSIFVTGTNYTNLTSHLENSFYVPSTSAPDFLMRLEGNLSASKNGIESLVNTQKLTDQNIIVQYKSVVDYIYFSNNNPQKYIIPAVANLILDNQSDHLRIYNVSSVAIPA